MIPIEKARVIVARRNYRFWRFWGGGGLEGSTSGLLKEAFLVRSCQGFWADVKLRGLPPCRA